tara:strand:- start:1720 stop:2169 length:450 start_codon:yes stop_codon:yes gene_type:complete
MKKIVSIILFLIIAGCGFKPIFSSSDTNFSINKIEYNSNLGKIINNNLKGYLNKEQKEFNFDLMITSEESKLITLKNKKGDPVSFKLTIDVLVSVLENNKIKLEKVFQETFNYNNTSKKFELSMYENEIRNGMLERISEQIITSLYTIQ